MRNVLTVFRRSLLVRPGPDSAPMPSRAYPDDAGLDLAYFDAGGASVFVAPNSFVDLPCGISLDLPEGHWGLITGRSSTMRKRGLLVSQGVLDHGYQGPLFVGVWNLQAFPVVVESGERLGQLILLPYWSGSVVEGFSSARQGRSRGLRGFGSSGT